MQNPWKTLASKIVFKNPWFQLREDSVINPSGEETTYTLVQTNGPSVFIIAENQEQKFAIVRVFRYGNTRWGWELPGGGSENGEDTRVGAKRELKEETGLSARVWLKIGQFEPFSGLSDELSDVFLAKDLTESAENHQKEEGISEMKWVSLDEALQMIDSGELFSGQSIAALFLFQRATK